MGAVRNFINKLFPPNTLVHKWTDVLKDSDTTVSSLYGGNAITTEKPLQETGKGVVNAGIDVLEAYTNNLLNSINRTSAGVSAGAQNTVFGSNLGMFIQKYFIWIVAIIILLLVFKPFKKYG